MSRVVGDLIMANERASGYYVADNGADPMHTGPIQPLRNIVRTATYTNSYQAREAASLPSRLWTGTECPYCDIRISAGAVASRMPSVITGASGAGGTAAQLHLPARGGRFGRMDGDEGFILGVASKPAFPTRRGLRGSPALGPE